MSEIMKTKYLLFFLSILQCLNLNSMEKEVDTTAIAIEKAKAAVEKSQETIKNLPSLLQKSKNATQARKQNQINGIVNQLKNDNTALLKMGKYFAFYKRDTVRMGCFALDLFAEYFVYKKIVEQKIDYVLEAIKQDSVNLANLMRQADEAQKAHDKRNRIAKFVVNRFKTLPEIVALKKYVNDKHKMIGYNPFKRNVLPYIILSLLKTKAVHFAESLLLTRLDGTCILNNEILDTSLCAYEKDNDGNLKRLNSTPFSIANILMFILNPRYMLERLNFSTAECLALLKRFGGLEIPDGMLGIIKGFSSSSSGDYLKGLNKLSGVNLPDIFFSDVVKVLASIGSLGLAVKFTDTILNSSWSNYLVKNRANFLKLLTRYNLVDKSNTADLEKLEKELRKFIVDGHAQGIFSGWGIKKQYSAQFRVKLLFLLPFIGALAYKICT